MISRERKVAVEVSLDEQLERREWMFLVWRLAGFRCARCGRGREEVSRLIAHHRDHDGDNNTIRNGECLCQSCHSSHHHKGKKISLENRRGMSKRAKAQGLGAIGTQRAVKKNQGRRLSEEHKRAIRSGWDKMSPGTRKKMSAKLSKHANARSRIGGRFV